jgi:hypothetical protein
VNLLLLNYTITSPGQGQKEHINLDTTKSVTKQKLNQGKENRQLKPPIVAQHQVEQWEEEGMETILSKK